VEFDLTDYGLTPRTIAYIAVGWTASALPIWLAHRWRAARDREFGARRDR
jgi:hypothetical protein